MSDKPKLEYKRTINVDQKALSEMWSSKGKKQQLTTTGDVTVENYWKDNTVKTNKYTMINFIPKNLFGVQFAKLPNIYFVVITIMQTIPAISISNG